MGMGADGVSLNKTNRRTVLRLWVLVFAMFGFGFALWPIYIVLCDVTGFLGKTDDQAVAVSELEGVADTSRTITVEFLANLNIDAPWEFKPSVRRMEVHPGEFYRTSYVARNLSGIPLTGQAVPSVAPGEAASYFQKIECFCFNQQAFDGDESKDMPLVFRIDPQISEEITTLTLSYTFFRLETDS